VVTIDAGAGSDYINLNNPFLPNGLTSLRVNGDDPTASDTLIVNGLANIADGFVFKTGATPDAGSVTNLGLQPSVTYTGVEHLKINGQNSNTGTADTLQLDTFGTDGNIVLTPGSTFDSGHVDVRDANFFLVNKATPLDFSGLGTGGSIKLLEAPIEGNGRFDNLIYNGTALSDIFTVAANGDVTLNTQIVVQTASVVNLTLAGLDGDDIFNIPGNHPFTDSSSTPGSGTITVDGGNPSASDVLNFSGAGAAITADLGARTVSENGFGPVSFTGIEIVNIAAATAALTATLTANDDELTYRPTGNAAGTFQNAGDNTTFNFTGVAGAFTVNGLASVADVVTVQGTNGRDQVLVDSPKRTVTVTNGAGTALKTVTLAADIENVSVQGLNGNDTFLVVPAPTVGPNAGGNLLVNIDGGQPGASDALVIATAAGGTLPATDFVVHAVGLSPGEGRVRVYRDAVAMPDIAYTNIEVVSPNVVVTAGAPQLMVIGPDTSESNEFRTTAMHLGAGRSINVDNLAIFPSAGEHPSVPADVDFFQIVAAETGTIDVRLLFEQIGLLASGNPGLPGNGNLDLAVFDQNGDLVGSSTTATNDERLTFPAVQDVVYFIRVTGATATAINAYELTINNEPAPIPNVVDLIAASDSGRSDTDNITRVTTAAFDIFLDDDRLNSFANLGLVADTTNNDAQDANVVYGVQVFNNDVSIGFAFYTGDGNRWRFTATAGDLQEGHNNFLAAAVWVRDRSTPTVLGRGMLGASLSVTLDTTAPLPPTIALDPAVTDSGIATDPTTLADRITRYSTPGFVGRAEADNIVRLFADGPVVTNNLVDASDTAIGVTVAVPLDGDEAFPGGQYRATSTVDLNNPTAGFPRDGQRQIGATAEDLAGNVSPAAFVDILVDTTPGRVTRVDLAGNRTVFATKPDLTPTPAVHSLFIEFSGGPPAAAGLSSPAVDNNLAKDVRNYQLVGDHNGNVLIGAAEIVSSTPEKVVVRLDFIAPLADDRFTLTIKESISDAAGNLLDGDSQAQSPGSPTQLLPSGNGLAGGNFVARFTVDSRPEIGAISEGLVYVDINGNLEWDPTGSDNDATNRDFVFQFGQLVDAHFAGNFAKTGAATASGFDKLGAYGKFGPSYSFLLDTDDDGVGDLSSPMPAAYQVNGIPVAGNFNAAHPGDEIGLFDGRYWYLDTNGNNQIDIGERIAANYNGLPVVGDFNGDGKDDLAVFDNATNLFVFDTDRNGIADFFWYVADDVKRFVGLSGFTDRPVAGDLNLDGIDDIGLWVKDRQGTLPRNSGEYFFWVSDVRAVNPALVFNAYSPAPLGNDLFAEFGDELALPIFGNFDPPVASSVSVNENLLHRDANPLDVNGDGLVTPIDALLIINILNSRVELPTYDMIRAYATTGYNAVDPNGDRLVTPIDALLVINELNRNRHSGEGEQAEVQPLESAVSADAFFAQLGTDAEDLKKKRAW